MYMQPKVSIIVPVYNVEKYLDACVQSLLNQTLKDIEIILVNDASPDDSSSICRKYESIDSRVRVFDKSINEGLGLTRNAGLELAKGQYVAFCDSDDYVDTHIYEEMSNHMDQHNLDVCYCNYALDNDGTINYKSGSPIDEMYFLGKDKVRQYVLEMIGPKPEYPSDVKYMISSCMAMYSRKVLIDNNVRFQNERKVLSEDTLFNLEFLSYSTNVGYLPNQYYYYRYTPSSLSRTYNHKKAQTFITLINEVETQLKKFYTHEEYAIHFQRFVFYIFRLLIKYEAIKNINSNRKLYVKQWLEADLLHDTLTNYPYWKLKPSKSFFFFCMKNKMVSLLIWMSLLENKIRKNL